MIDEKNNSSTFSIGWLPHRSLLPLKKEILRISPSNLKLCPGEENQITQWVTNRIVHVAPCPATCLLNNPYFEMAFPLGISLDGTSEHLLLGMEEKNEELLEYLKIRNASIRQIFEQARTLLSNDARQAAQFIWQTYRDLPMDRSMIPALIDFGRNASSSAGSTLTKILFRLWFGEDAYHALIKCNGPYPPSVRPKMKLLVGDESLIYKQNFAGVLNLTRIWETITGLPFILSVWQYTKAPISHIWRKRIFEAAELAEARMHVEPAVYFPNMAITDQSYNEAELAAYWKGIRYHFGASHYRSLLLFLCLARYFPDTQYNESFVVKAIRWQQLSHDLIGSEGHATHYKSTIR